MSSETSTRTPSRADTGVRPYGNGTFQAWHFYLLLGMAGATAAVWRAVDTQPAALLLLSGAVLAAALVAMAVHYTMLAFTGGVQFGSAALAPGTRTVLEQEKAMVLRSIKELEFDRAMRKVGQADYDEINARLRARAVSLMEQLEVAPVASIEPRPAAEAPSVVAPASATCRSCGVENDADARFCKACGTKVEQQ